MRNKKVEYSPRCYFLISYFIFLIPYFLILLMATISKSKLKLAIAVPAFIFLACTFISFSTKYKTHQDQLSLAIILDLLITAPLAYYLIIRKTVHIKSYCAACFYGWYCCSWFIDFKK